MRNNRVWSWGLIGLSVGAAVLGARAADRDGPVIARTSVRMLRDFEPVLVTASSPLSVFPVELPQASAASEIRRLSSSGGVAGAPVGSTRVYGNEIAVVQNYYPPGTNQRLADDMRLANGPCNAVYYNLAVFGLVNPQLPPPPQPFNVRTELWTDDPCTPGATIIPGTEANFTNIARDNTIYLLEAEFTGGAIPIPGTVWMAATFSANNAGWIVAGQAEIGSTQNFFSENDTDPNPDVCALFNFTGNNPPHAGFWANIYCQTTAPPNGACCNGTTCTQTTQAACLSPGVWRGAFTTCQPNACLTGACCTGVDFEACADTNEPGCPDGLFRPGTVCLNGPCGENFEVYRNDFATGIFVPIDSGEKWGDDLTLGPGAPCQLTAYEVLLAGDGTPPAPATFNAHVELWTNDDRGTPTVDVDDRPLAVIPGTQRDFNGLAADLTRQRLLAGPFNSLALPEKVWIVVNTNSNTAGPIFGGLADIGFSQDGFRIFNDPSAPNAWSTDLFRFGTGFDPTNCPGPNCVPAGSFRAIVWCAGAPPAGACCNDFSGTCTDGLLSTECEGRWLEDASCDFNPFAPPCGNHACCHPHPLNPASIICQDLTPEECTSVEGSSAPGLFCVDVTTCPRPSCINRNGDCFASHVGTGCENAFCCEKVCAANPSCCSGDWGPTCVERARALCSTDHCADALPITGQGTFPFDTTSATTDGPAHAACATAGGDEQIEKDIWYCWRSPCTNTVFVRTCGQTTVDTKLAVYDGCTCPPTDAALLDCGDDRCGPLQSTAVFHAVAGRSYLIRLGNYPGTGPGTGSLTISCGPPNQLNCPTTGDCCALTGAPGCVNEPCCEAVCGCDSFCCETEWDQECATTGFRGSGCGAQVLCPALCGSCPAGTVAFTSPSPGILDAARPHLPNDGTQLLGIDTVRVTAPAGADLIGCWAVCETASTGAANGVAGVTDEGGGQFIIQLARPITAGSVTKITYAGNGTFARYLAHPANMNADGFANMTDVRALVDALDGIAPLPTTVLSGDSDRSGAVTGADVLDVVGLLTSEGDYANWNNSTKPTATPGCP